MKKIFLCCLSAALLSGMIMSCRRGPEGPMGQIGPAGETGTPGPAGKNGTNGEDGEDGKDGTNGKNGTNGVDGNMKIIARDFALKNWSTVGTPYTLQGQPIKLYYGYKADAALSEITSTILSKGAILIYHHLGNTLKLIPYTNMADGNVQFSVWSDLNTGKVTINFGYDAGHPFPAQDDEQFRAIIIPGAVSGRVQAGNRTIYNIDQLRSMSYEQVCATLNIQP